MTTIASLTNLRLELCLNQTHGTGRDTKHASNAFTSTLWESKIKDSSFPFKKTVHGIGADLKDVRNLFRGEILLKFLWHGQLALPHLSLGFV